MVTIDPDQPIQNRTLPNLQPTAAGKAQGEFDAIFRESLVEPSTRVAASDSTPSTGVIRPAAFSGVTTLSTPMTVNRLHRLIDALEAYQQQLMAGGTSLKTVEPLVKQLASRSETLSAVSRTGGADSLNVIVDQALTLAAVEIAKFNSGHYNDPG